MRSVTLLHIFIFSKTGDFLCKSLALESLGMQSPSPEKCQGPRPMLQEAGTGVHHVGQVEASLENFLVRNFGKKKRQEFCKKKVLSQKKREKTGKRSFAKFKESVELFFVCLHKTPTLRHRIRFFPNLQAKKHPFSHQPSFPSGKKVPAVFSGGETDQRSH